MALTSFFRILLRRHLKLLPEDLQRVIKSVTFTNGGMRYQLINFRISQILLKTPYLGPVFSSLFAKLPTALIKAITRRQLSSIWGPLANPLKRDEDIEAMIAANSLNGGQAIAHKTVSYLHDRARFESRWYRALKTVKSQIESAAFLVRVSDFLVYLPI